VAATFKILLGEVLVVPREGGDWCAAVRTPTATFVRGDCPPEAYGEKAYSSRQKPSAPHEVEGLRWGVGKTVEEATGKAADLSFWRPPGLLFEVYWGKGLLGLYKKEGAWRSHNVPHFNGGTHGLPTAGRSESAPPL
jgi:hypothetical protein